MSDEVKEGWRIRLVDEIEKATKADPHDKNDPRPSMAEASKRAGHSRNYVQQALLNLKDPDKSPRMEHLIEVCQVLDISMVHVLTGVRWDRDIQEAVAALAALKQHDPAAWKNFQGLLGGFQQRVLDEVDSNMEAASQRVRKSDKGSR